MRTTRLSLALLLVACTTVAHRPAPVFSFHSNLWLNLHHYLRASARGLPQAPLSPDEQATWDVAVAYYKQHYANRDLLFDDGMVAIKATLRHVPNDANPPEFADDPELNDVLISAARVYRAHAWPEHDRMNRAWIAAVTPLVERHGETLSRRIAAAYGETWPSQPIDVDLSVQAGPVGAYTTLEPHVTVSPERESQRGLASLEILFHESSHQRRLRHRQDDRRPPRSQPLTWPLHGLSSPASGRGQACDARQVRGCQMRNCNDATPIARLKSSRRTCCNVSRSSPAERRQNHDL